MAKTKAEKPATLSEIRNIVGPLSGEILAAIDRVGATPDEVLRAYEWEEQDEYIGTGPDSPEGRVKLVYDILRDDRDFLYANDRP